MISILLRTVKKLLKLNILIFKKEYNQHKILMHYAQHFFTMFIKEVIKEEN